MVFEPEIFDYIPGDGSDFGADVLPALAADHQLAAFPSRRILAVHGHDSLRTSKNSGEWGSSVEELAVTAVAPSSDRRSLVLGLSSRVSWPAMSVTFEMEDAVPTDSSRRTSCPSTYVFGIEPHRAAGPQCRSATKLAMARRTTPRTPVGCRGRRSVRRGDVVSRSLGPRRCVSAVHRHEADLLHRRSVGARSSPFRHVPRRSRTVRRGVHVVLRYGSGAFGVTSVPVRWIASGTDALVRCPADHQRRCVDVHIAGRRCPVQHAELLDAARQRHLVYQFDTLSGAALSDWSEHRFSLAEQAQRSRFYVCHRAKFDETIETGDVQEFGGRFFDAMAAGAIPIGDLPVSNTSAKRSLGPTR